MHTTATPPADWNQLRSDVRAFIRRRVRHEADADDIVQHCFLQWQQHRERLRDPGRIQAWMYRTARHAVIDYYRAQARRVAMPLDAIEDLPASAEHSDAASRPAHRLGQCMQPLLGTLTPADQQVLGLVDLKGHRQTGTASALGLSISAAKSRVQRARKRLKAAVEACCDVRLDARGGVMSYQRKTSPCPCAEPCAGASTETASRPPEAHRTSS